MDALRIIIPVVVMSICLPPRLLSAQTKAEIMQAVWATENKKPQDYYGSVIDQNGAPVKGATVIGTLFWIQGFDVGEKMEKHETITDKDGLFEFTGFHAARLGVYVVPNGYVHARLGAGYRQPASGNQTSLRDRAVVTMWKLSGPEPMVHAKIHAYIPCDGTTKIYDPLTGKESPNGDLSVALTRFPEHITRGKPFDWQLSLSMAGGGLLEVADLFPFKAPRGGYIPSVMLKFKKTADVKDFDVAPEREYYFLCHNRSVFGRMKISVQADFEPPPTSFDVEIYANPAGSTNLEFERSKEIRP